MHKRKKYLGLIIALLSFAACSQTTEKKSDVVPSVYAEETSSETTDVPPGLSEPKIQDHKDPASSLYPLQATVIPDQFDITSMTVAGVPYVRPENENINNIVPGNEPDSVTINLANVTVNELMGAIYSQYDNDVNANLIYSDENCYFKGISFVSCKVEVLDNISGQPLNIFNAKTQGELPVKAVSTCEGLISNRDISFGGINKNMNRETVELKLGEGYEVANNNGGTTVYYQNSKGVIAISYIYSSVYQAEYIDRIIVIVK